MQHLAVDFYSHFIGGRVSVLRVDADRGSDPACIDVDLLVQLRVSEVLRVQDAEKRLEDPQIGEELLR